ncbi:MAG: crossover junction endodeoxyribonuclease RuvC [Candidatus Sungbacteria bacterium]|nr:crossover junction endodeoxyribonuclease RuvC [Candidatus Sungbacteria bacterium]
MKVLGIDPGTTRLGYAIVEGTLYEARLLTSGVFGNARLDRGARLSEIHTSLSSLIERQKPDCVAIESLFFSKNIKTALPVAEARGVILLTAQNANLTVYEYTPTQIKIALTGAGGATKQQVAAMAKKILKHTARPKWDDESDAIATALTGLVVAGGMFKGRY